MHTPDSRSLSLPSMPGGDPASHVWYWTVTQKWEQGSCADCKFFRDKGTFSTLQLRKQVARAKVRWKATMTARHGTACAHERASGHLPCSWNPQDRGCGPSPCPQIPSKLCDSRHVPQTQRLDYATSSPGFLSPLSSPRGIPSVSPGLSFVCCQSQGPW